MSRSSEASRQGLGAHLLSLPAWSLSDAFVSAWVSLPPDFLPQASPLSLPQAGDALLVLPHSALHTVGPSQMPVE